MISARFGSVSVAAAPNSKGASKSAAGWRIGSLTSSGGSSALVRRRITVRHHFLGIDLGVHKEVDQRITRLAMRRALRHGIEIAPDFTAFAADHILDLRKIAVKLLGITGPSHTQPGVAVAERRLVIRRDGEEMRLGLQQQRFRL